MSKSELDLVIGEADLKAIKERATALFVDKSPHRYGGPTEFRFETIVQATFDHFYCMGLFSHSAITDKIYKSGGFRE